MYKHTVGNKYEFSFDNKKIIKTKKWKPENSTILWLHPSISKKMQLMTDQRTNKIYSSFIQRTQKNCKKNWKPENCLKRSISNKMQLMTNQRSNKTYSSFIQRTNRNKN